MTVEEIADYLKLLGFTIEQDGPSLCNIYLFPSQEYIIAQMHDRPYGRGVALYLYGEDTDNMLLGILSKGYTVTSYEGSHFLYDITDSNSRRNSGLS